MALAPVLRKNVVNINVLAEEHDVVELSTRPKVLRALLHQQSVDTLVCRGQPHAHSLEAVRAEDRLGDCCRVRTSLQPAWHLHEISSDARFDCGAVELAEDAVPVPLLQF